MTVPYTFANATGNISLSELDINFANVKAAATTAGTVTANAQSNITSVGTLTSLSVSGNVTAANFIGNVVSVVANAIYAASAGTSNIANVIIGNAQPNITSVGSLTSLTVSGNITSGNISGGNISVANIVGTGITGSGNVSGGNISTAGSSTASVNLTTTLSLGTVAGSVVIDVALSSCQLFTTSGNVNLSFSNWASSSVLQSVTLEMFVSSPDHVITVPGGIQNSTGITGFEPLAASFNFPDSGYYTLVFSSSDGGTNLTVNENNSKLRPYNSSSEVVINVDAADLDLGTTYSIYTPDPVGTVGTAVLGNGVAGQIKVLASQGTGTWTVAVDSASWGDPGPSGNIDFSGADQTITLVWSADLGAWIVLNSYGAVTLS